MGSGWITATRLPPKDRCSGRRQQKHPQSPMNPLNLSRDEGCTDGGARGGWVLMPRSVVDLAQDPETRTGANQARLNCSVPSF